MLIIPFLLGITMLTAVERAQGSQASEALSTHNAHQLKLSGTKDLPGPLVGFMAADPICTVGACALVPPLNHLYVIRKAYTEREGGKEVGLYTYDLDSMNETHYRPIPKGSGDIAERAIRLSPWFDQHTGYFVLGSRSAVHAETGDLKMIEGLPERGCELAANPAVDNTHILYREKELPWRDKGIFYVNRNTLKVARHLGLPSGERDVVIEGASGTLVLARAQLSAHSFQLIVFEAVAGEDMLKEKAVLDVKGFRPGTSAVDHLGQRWAISESAWGPNNADERRLRIYDIRSMRVLQELPEEYFCGWIQGMSFVEPASILLVRAEHAKILLVLDVNSAKVLKRLPVDGTRPFSDDRGYWIGVSGCTTVQLFRIQPKGGAQ